MTTTNTHPELTVRTIASTFSSMLRAQLTEAQMVQAADAARYNDGGAVALLCSLCDMNSILCDAVRTVLGAERCRTMPDDEGHAWLRRSWTMARATGFSADPSLSLSNY